MDDPAGRFGSLLIPMTIKPALIFVIIGQLLRWKASYYPLGGAVLGYWLYVIATSHYYGTHESAWLCLTYVLAGTAAGPLFWWVGVRNLKYDLRTYRSEDKHEA